MIMASIKLHKPLPTEEGGFLWRISIIEGEIIIDRRGHRGKPASYVDNRFLMMDCLGKIETILEQYSLSDATSVNTSIRNIRFVKDNVIQPIRIEVQFTNMDGVEVYNWHAFSIRYNNTKDALEWFKNDLIDAVT